MKFAAIVPPQGLRVLERAGLGYHLCLAQYLLKDKAYRNYYKVLGRLGHFIIVDNGAAERDTPQFEEVVRVAEYISASEIVLPDVVHDMKATVERTLQYAHLVPSRKRFIVPQGRNWDEVVDCCTAVFKGLDYQVATIGLSKYQEGFEGGRPELLRRLMGELGPEWLSMINIHVLGIAFDPFREIQELYDIYPGIRGVDTGAPVAWAQRHRSLPDVAWTGEHIPLEWDEPFDLDLATRNIMALSRHAARPM